MKNIRRFFNRLIYLNCFRMLLLLTILFPCCLFAQEVIPLYNGLKIPLAKEGTEIPTLTIFKPVKMSSNYISVIVCSGGTYKGRANNVEGFPACRKLQNAGIFAILLDYRVPNELTMERTDLVPLTDAQRAIQYVREHANQYNLDPKRIGIMGFSAGGHLVSTVITHFNKTELENARQTSLRPDFAIMVYPLISFADSLSNPQIREARARLLGGKVTPENIYEFSNELHVSNNTPPSYLSSGLDDEVVNVKHSLLFAAALRQHHVPVELFLYKRGPHGYGIKNNLADVQWIDDCIDWMKRRVLLKNKPIDETKRE